MDGTDIVNLALEVAPNCVRKCGGAESDSHVRIRLRGQGQRQFLLQHCAQHRLQTGKEIAVVAPAILQQCTCHVGKVCVIVTTVSVTTDRLESDARPLDTSLRHRLLQEMVPGHTADTGMDALKLCST